MKTLHQISESRRPQSRRATQLYFEDEGTFDWNNLSQYITNANVAFDMRYHAYQLDISFRQFGDSWEGVIYPTSRLILDS